MSSTITPAMRVVNRFKKRVIREVFREVFFKYIRGGIGTDLTWRLQYGKEGRKYVLNRMKVILSWVSNDDVYILTDLEIFARFKNEYKKLAIYYGGLDYDEYIMVKLGEVDL